jgi:glycosyltransferase-like protein
MRVALATYSTRPRGGVVHTLALAEALAGLGHDVTVWTLARGGDQGFFRPVDPAVEVRLVPFSDIADEGVGPRIVRSIVALRDAFDPTGYDVVHAQDCISANALAPCIRTVHHLDTFTTAELAACHERAIVEPVAHVCVSAAVAAELGAGWGITAKVIPNGVDHERFEAAASSRSAACAARSAWRARLGPGPLLLAVGGIEPRKGSLELLDAVHLLRTAHPGVRLVIAGGETLFDYRDYRERFELRRRALALDVELLGPVAHDELPALVAAADVFAFPSTKEGFGLAAMEALAAGVPVVARDLPVLREVFGAAVRYGDDAATLAAALDDALRDGVDAGRIEAGRQLARSHSWLAAAQAHVELYERLARTPASVRTGPRNAGVGAHRSGEQG